VQTAVLATGVHFARLVFDLEPRPAVVLALALFTPSTGFILDSLPGFGLSAAHQRWVKDHAISTEFLALGALFVAVQSESLQTLGLATGALAAMVFVLPVVFRAFANVVLPYAPRSEFAFLVILALACAYLTRQLGVYYLVGAFVVGVTAVRLRKRLPALASERMLVGIELFASFFIPFYFFKAGLHLDRHSFTLRTVGLGLALVAVVVPVRVLVVAVLRHATLGDGARDGTRVGVSLVPTLVFTLVLADILKIRYDVGPELFGALIVYALVNTTIPGLVLKAPAVEFTAPEAPREGDPTAAQPAPDPGTHA
jgi:Kef-type K+ transport system membrane component KefB